MMLATGPKTSKSSYIAARVKLIAGLSPTEAIGAQVPTSKGVGKYSKADLKYDLKRQFLLQDSEAAAETPPTKKPKIGIAQIPPIVSAALVNIVLSR
jgi:hypothetical protein